MCCIADINVRLCGRYVGGDVNMTMWGGESHVVMVMVNYVVAREIVIDRIYYKCISSGYIFCDY